MAEKTLYNAPSSNHIIANYSDDPFVMRENFQKSLSREFYTPYYKPFLPLSHAVFNGESFDWALAQARCIAEKAPKTEKAQRLAKSQEKIAIEALETLRPFFSNDPTRWLRETTIISYQAPGDVQIPIKLYGIRRADSETRICLFNYWKTNLTDQQIGILISLAKYYTSHYPEFSDIGLEFIDISYGDHSSGRCYRTYDWKSFPLLPDLELKEVMASMAAAYIWAKQNNLERPLRSPRPKPLSDTDDLFPEGI